MDQIHSLQSVADLDRLVRADQSPTYRGCRSLMENALVMSIVFLILVLDLWLQRLILVLSDPRLRRQVVVKEGRRTGARRAEQGIALHAA
jgi:hypothetical protein